MIEKKKPGRPRKELYKLTVAFSGNTIHSKGSTVLEALQKLPHPGKITTKGLITLTKGEKKMERMFMPMEMKRILYPIAQVYVAKGMEFLLK